MEPVRTERSPYQFLLPLTLLVLMSCRTSWCPSWWSWPRSQRSQRRMQEKEEQWQTWLLPHANKRSQQTTATTAMCELHHSSSFISTLHISHSVSLGAHPNPKQTGEGILGTVAQSRQVDTLQSHHAHTLPALCFLALKELQPSIYSNM